MSNLVEFLQANGPITVVLGFVLTLIPAVIIHELGHFFAAKWVGITIMEFGIGFPPRMVRLFRLDGTDYTLNWLPLGGFVRPIGEDMVAQANEEGVNADRAEAQVRGIAKPRAVSDVGPWQRIFFMAGGAIANLLSAIVLFTIAAMLGLPQVVGGSVVIEDIKPGSPLALAGLQPGDAIQQINGVYVGVENGLAPLDALAPGQTANLTVQRGVDGPLYQVTYTAPAASYPLPDAQYVRVFQVVQGAPAYNAGIRPDDLILAFNGQPITGLTIDDEVITPTEQLQMLTRANLGREISLLLRQGEGQLRTVTLTPRVNPPANEGSMGIQMSLLLQDGTAGVQYLPGLQEDIVRYGLGEALTYGVQSIGGLLQAIVDLPVRLIRGSVSLQEARPVSILGISQLGGYFLNYSLTERLPSIFLNFVATMSVALGLTNLLPIPALDGGRILFVLVEMVRGKPIAPEREGLVHLIGLALLLSLTVVIIINDVVNPITSMLPPSP